MSMLSQSLRNGYDVAGSFANRPTGQCLSVRITLVRNTDSFRLS
jgi:hypothetical protein